MMDIERLEAIAKELNDAIAAGEVVDMYQAADGLALHHNGLFFNVKNGKLRAAKVGKTWFTTPEAVKAWRDSQPFHRK